LTVAYEVVRDSVLVVVDQVSDPDSKKTTNRPSADTDVIDLL